MSSRRFARCARRGLRVVVDTNVWVSGLALPRSRPGEVIRAVREGRLTPIASWELAAEIVNVLQRPKSRALGIEPGDVSDIVFVLGVILPDVEIDITLRDPDDAAVVSAAVSGRADAIVTGDRGLLDDAELRVWLGERGVELLTPAELLERLG